MLGATFPLIILGMGILAMATTVEQAMADDPEGTPPKKGKRNVAILVWDRVELLDFTGPAEVFSGTSFGQAFRVYTVAETTDRIRTGGIIVVPEYTLADAPKPDILVVPGGNALLPRRNQRMVEWVRNTARDAELVFSVCTGSLVLAEAGLLDGKNATTHHYQINELKRAAPQATVLEKRRFVEDGKLITAAGVSAGIDGALRVVERLHGRETARTTALGLMEYRWDPDGQTPAEPAERK
jgi:transcriptional regulator GlxA family with amidase domain